MDRKIVQVVVLLLIAAAGCKPKENVTPQSPTHVVGPKVYVVCEGAYGNGNSALSLYLPQTDSVYEDVYRAANHIAAGTPWGDVFQSMVRMGGYYFLCINNSDKIAVIDTGNWQLVTNIAVTQPRYILPVSATKAYVSTLSGNNVYVINPQSFQVTGSIATPFKHPEGMALVNNKALICNWDTAAHALTTIDAATDAAGPPIPFSNVSPTDVAVDAEGMIWVLSGNVYSGRAAMLSRLNPATGTTISDFPFPASADPLRLCFNAAKDTLYWIEANYSGTSNTNNGIFRMSIHGSGLPVTPFVAAPYIAPNYSYFWALGIEPSTGNIYVGDPKGFTQRGLISVYRPDGTQIKTFHVGVGPGHFYFEQ